MIQDGIVSKWEDKLISYAILTAKLDYYVGMGLEGEW